MGSSHLNPQVQRLQSSRLTRSQRAGSCAGGSAKRHACCSAALPACGKDGSGPHVTALSCCACCIEQHFGAAGRLCPIRYARSDTDSCSPVLWWTSRRPPLPPLEADGHRMHPWVAPLASSVWLLPLERSFQRHPASCICYISGMYPM